MVKQWEFEAEFRDENGREFGEFVQAAGVNMLGLVPSIVKAWKASGCMKGLDWSSIKAFSSTGECSNAEDYLFLMSYNIKNKSTTDITSFFDYTIDGFEIIKNKYRQITEPLHSEFDYYNHTEKLVFRADAELNKAIDHINHKEKEKQSES